MAAKWRYLPILKWKQGERLALKHLTPGQWSGVVPLIELPAIDASPSADSLRAALPAYLTKISKQMAQSYPADVPLLIDARYVSPGYPKQLNLIRVICAGLAKQTKRRIFPVLSETLVARYTANLSDVGGFEEYVLRIQTQLTTDLQVEPIVKALTGSGIASKSRLHIVIDQYSIVNDDPLARYTMVRPFLDKALTAGCASTTVAGGSFPVNLVGYKQGVQDIARVEWAVWKAVRRNADYATVRFGDYTVSNPAPAPDLDPAMMNPSVAIRYATSDHWRLYKAGGFKKGKPNQYQNLCVLLTGDTVYSGASFSDGDDRYDRAAKATLGNGNPSSWRRDATSHHVVLISSLL